MGDTDKLNGWEQWGKYVVKELERLNTRYERLEEKLDRIDRRMVKVERIFWLLGGLIAVFTPVFIWAVIETIKRLLSL